MSIKTEAYKIIDQLPEDANWDDLVKQLYRERKISLGMSDLEVVQHGDLNDNQIATIMGRVNSSSSLPDDMRNTKTYQPDNTLTASWVLVALAPLLFISILLAPAAYALSAIGVLLGLKAMLGRKHNAWLPTALGAIELILFVALPAGMA